MAKAQRPKWYNRHRRPRQYKLGTGQLFFGDRLLGTVRFYPHQQTVTGRMVSEGPNFDYQLPKGTGKISMPISINTANYFAQMAAAERSHRAALDEARAAGHTVIEHTSADASILMNDPRLDRMHRPGGHTPPPVVVLDVDYTNIEQRILDTLASKKDRLK